MFRIIEESCFQVTQRIKEEEGRVKDHLHPTTLEKLKPMLDRILIKDQFEPIYIESQKLLRDEKIEGRFRAKFDLFSLESFFSHRFTYSIRIS